MMEKKNLSKHQGIKLWIQPKPLTQEDTNTFQILRQKDYNEHILKTHQQYYYLTEIKEQLK